MSDLGRDFEKFTAQRSPYAPKAPEHPPGWEPGVELKGDRGVITSRPLDSASPDWSYMLKSWGFDPAHFEVEEPVQVRTWDAFAKNDEGELVTKQLWYHRANIRRRSKDEANVAALEALIRKRRPLTPRGPGEGLWYVIAPSDPQIGKGEGGGTEATVRRFQSTMDQAIERLKRLRRAGLKVPNIALPSGGDLCENVCGWYPGQAFQVDLHPRAQKDVACSLYEQAIDELAPLCDRMTVASPNSNHGENRQGGKLVTDDSDSLDLEVMDTLRRVYAKNPGRYGHVEFVIPEDASAVLLDLGVPVGLSHGHKAQESGTAMQRMVKWMAGQVLGSQPIAPARIILTGHYHHAFFECEYGRLWLGLPSLDGGSKWLTQKYGKHSPPGLVTFVVDPERSLGIRDYELLEP